MKLSVLLCTTTTRVENFLPKIVTELRKQIDAVGTKEVEILYLGDNKQRTVGRKRNDLLSLAQGDYICFVDDDDMVMPNYLAAILPQLDGATDVVTFTVAISFNGRPGNPTFFSKDYPHDANLPDRYQRLPNHVSVVKRALALKTMFRDISRGEDGDYAARLRPLLTTQKTIDQVLYHYAFNSNTTEAQKR